MRKVFVIISSLTFLVLVGGAIYLWYEARGVRGLDIDLIVPAEISVGIPFNLEVDISNDSKNILKEAQLMIELPEHMVFLGSSPDKTVDSKNLGNLGVGSLTQESYRLLSLAGENTIKEIKATVTYLPAALGSRFEKSSSVTFSVLESSLTLDMSLPQKVFSGERFEVTVAYKNNTGEDLNNLKLKVIYPPAFTFREATLRPDFGNNSWDLGDLRSNSEGELVVAGELTGPDDAFFEFGATLEADFLGQSYAVAEKAATIAIEPSPLSLAIGLNNDSAFIAHLGDELNYVINFLNNTDVGLRDAVIKAKLTGAMFDLTSLNTNAYLSTVNNTLVWNTSNTPSLSVLAPGASGSVDFKLRVKNNYPITRLSDKNFTLKAEVEIESPTVPYNVAAQKTVSVVTLETKVGGKIGIDAKAFFRDAPSGILNRGPWPMKVGQATQFTIHWLVSNASTDVKNVEVKAFLGGNVMFTGVVKSTGASEPTYNERTQEVSWMIPNVPAGKGIINPPLETIFQVEATPGVNQVGSQMTLIQRTNARAEDDFTGEILTAEDIEITSARLDDPTVTGEQGIVIQ